MVAASRTIKADRRLQRWRLAHIAIIVLVPAVAAVGGVWLVATRRVDAWCVMCALVMWLLSGMGITVGYHRLFTHRAFETGPMGKTMLAALGGLAFQGPVFYWASLHRRHHELSDQNGDPHSPWIDGERELDGLRGFLHAHLFWMYRHPIPNPLSYIPDLMNDRLVARLNRMYLGFAIAGLLMPALAGFLIEGTWFGAGKGLLWGGLIRLFISGHLIWSINSVSHMLGRRDYQTHDESRNVAWLAIPTLGESWHNTHHASPSSASFSDRWWRIDLGGLLVSLLESLGLVWKVKKRTRVTHG